MDVFKDLNGYEKGVLARMLLRQLIKQGRLDEQYKEPPRHEIVIPVEQWQLQTLALFSEDAEPTTLPEKSVLRSRSGAGS
jgi:hypothetical protein